MRARDIALVLIGMLLAPLLDAVERRKARR